MSGNPPHMRRRTPGKCCDMSWFLFTPGMGGMSSQRGDVQSVDLLYSRTSVFHGEQGDDEESQAEAKRRVRGNRVFL
jgi:hypothetical protein